MVAQVCNLLAAVFATVSIALVAPIFDLAFSKTPVGLADYAPRLHLGGFLPASLLAANPVITPAMAMFWTPLVIASSIFLKGLFSYFADVTINHAANRIALD